MSKEIHSMVKNTVVAFIEGETYFSVAETDCLAPIIDGDSLSLLDNVANKPQCCL